MEAHYLRPYWGKKGQPEFHCLVRNETAGVLSIESMDIVYTLDGQLVQEKHYNKQQTGKFRWHPYNDMDLLFAASTLLIVNDVPTQAFDQVTVTITACDEDRQIYEITYPFAVNEDTNYVDQIPAVEAWGTSWLPDGGWNWDHAVTNDREKTLTLEYVHRVTYDNGVPISAGAMKPGCNTWWLRTIRCLLS